MNQLKELMRDIIAFGEVRETRTGKVRSIWDMNMHWDLSAGFPAVTSKQLMWGPVVGELLWFLSGSESLSDLRKYTFGEDKDQWTIWTDDARRWHKTVMAEFDDADEHWREVFPQPVLDPDYVGALYGTQWRSFNDDTKSDQIQNLIKSLIAEPDNRDHIVMAWNPTAIVHNEMALKPCHLGFQCYVTKDKRLNLKWWQRSVDTFLGLPFNIASYALLVHLLAKWTGLKPGRLSCDLGDVHIYESHMDAVKEYLDNPVHAKPTLVLPEGCESLESTLTLTALDFRDALKDYQHSGRISAPLSVGS